MTVDTTGLVAGMDVTGLNIAAGTKILSITDATTLVLTRMVTGSGTNDLTYASTTYTPTNTYTGATHVTGSATVSFTTVSTNAERLSALVEWPYPARIGTMIFRPSLRAASSAEIGQRISP